MRCITTRGLVMWGIEPLGGSHPSQLLCRFQGVLSAIPFGVIVSLVVFIAAVAAQLVGQRYGLKVR